MSLYFVNLRRVGVIKHEADQSAMVPWQVTVFPKAELDVQFTHDHVVKNLGQGSQSVLDRYYTSIMTSAYLFFSEIP